MSVPPMDFSVPPPSLPPPIMQPSFPPLSVHDYPPPPFVPPFLFNQPPMPPPPTFPPSIDTHFSFGYPQLYQYVYCPISYTPPADTSASHKSDTSAATRYKDDTARERSKPRVKYSSERNHDRSYERYRKERYYKESRSRMCRSSKSPSHSRRYRSRSPSHSRRYRSRSPRERYRDRREHERRHHDYERRYRDRSHSRIHGSNDDRLYRSVTRHSPPSSSGEIRHSGTREMSPEKHETSHKPMSDREKILEEYRRNYCQTSDDFIEKMEQGFKDRNSDEEEVPKLYRSSPAELYYKPVEGGVGLQQTPELEKLCESFFKTLIERGRKARSQVDEIPPLKTTKPKMSNKLNEGSSSSENNDCLDEDGPKGYTDKMFELIRKQSHPRKLHNELWFNNNGEMNGGPLFQCSARAKGLDMSHGVYAGEPEFPKCVPQQNNLDKLYHYRITVSPPTNFLIETPTIIGHDKHDFLFSGFSMFSHYKLAKLPTCKVVRFHIEYTILYVEEPAPHNFSVQELDLFEEYLFYELLELVDLDLGKGTDTTCSQFHFMPRFVKYLPGGGCEILSMCEVLKYLIDESGLLVPPENLKKVLSMDRYTWQKVIDRIKGMIVTYPGKKPCSVRLDQLDRSRPSSSKDNPLDMKTLYPEIVHSGIRPPHSYAGNPKYQKAWGEYTQYRHLVDNSAKPSYKERQKLLDMEAKLLEMRTHSKMKRDITMTISSEGFHTTGLMCDIMQHAMFIPVLVRHLRFHKSLDSLEGKIGYVFKQRALLQTALTHPSYKDNYGTNPDHGRNSLTNCGIRQRRYEDRRRHHTRKKGIVTLFNIMSRFGKQNETESEIKHNERLEFLGDAVLEFLSSIHLFRMFPELAEGGLSAYRTSIVQNKHLVLLAKNMGLEKYLLYAHGSDLCRDVVIRHAMANCFEALMGALFLDGGLEVADRVFAFALWRNEQELLETWIKERAHPLQDQEPLGDRKYIKQFKCLQRLTEFEESIGVQFKHIRVLARAFTDNSMRFTHLTLGSNQRLEFLGDTVLQLVVSDRLYRRFPEYREGRLSVLRSSLVNNFTQSLVSDDLNMCAYAIYSRPKLATTKHKADLLEAFLGALYIDKNLQYCQAFSNACLFPRLPEFLVNQDWKDPKAKLQQYCLTLRPVEGGKPDIPLYDVIECPGPANAREYTVTVHFRGSRLATARGHSIHEAEKNAAKEALATAHELFPQIDHQKQPKRKRKRADVSSLKPEPKGRLNDDQQDVDQESSSDSDSGLIRKNEYDKLKEKSRKSDSGDE